MNDFETLSIDCLSRNSGVDHDDPDSFRGPLVHTYYVPFVTTAVIKVSVAMGVTKDITQAGDGRTFPKAGDKLTMHYQ